MEVKTIFSFVICFLVSLSVTTFLVNILAMIKEFQTNYITYMTSGVGCAILIVIFVYYCFKDFEIKVKKC